MGAVTALMYGDRDPSVAGMVLDSPFSSLKMLVEELVKEKISLPNFILNQALNLVKSTVQKKAKFNLEDIEPIEYAKRCFIPALFVAAKDDSFVKPHHAKLLHDAYPVDKNLINIEGDHNSTRPKFFKDSAAIFFHNSLRIDFIKEISDNYSGFYNSNHKDEKIEDKIKPSENILSLKLGRYDSIEPYGILDDEEEIFKKIMELSKKEYEEVKKDEDKNNCSDKFVQDVEKEINNKNEDQKKLNN
jgi:hypothetical protein